MGEPRCVLSNSPPLGGARAPSPAVLPTVAPPRARRHVRAALRPCPRRQLTYGTHRPLDPPVTSVRHLNTEQYILFFPPAAASVTVSKHWIRSGKSSISWLGNCNTCAHGRSGGRRSWRLRGRSLLGPRVLLVFRCVL